MKLKRILKDNFSEVECSKIIFYLNIPEYGNLGDQAIVLSTLIYIETNFPEYNIVKVYLNDISEAADVLKKHCKTEDIIFLPGGGNVGSWYWKDEQARRIVLENFRNCKIISMPQSVFFADDKKGMRELKKSQRIYNGNKNLVFFVREKYSYQFMKANFDCKVILIPDIVFLLGKYFKPRSQRTDENIIVCLRADKESNLGVLKRADLLCSLDKIFKEKLFLFDTSINREVLDATRKIEVYSLLEEFSRAKVVITDRLHGMIFSAITQTPCIVMKSLDTKIVGSYEWIKDLNYIKLLKKNDINSIMTAYDKLSKIEKFDNFKKSFNFKEYKKIKDEIKK